MLRSTTLLAFLGFSLLYLTSYSGGPTAQAGDVTGSPLTTQQCSGCHNGGNFDPVVEIIMYDANSTSVSSYEPGQLYTIEVSTAAQNSPAGYGFQAVVLDASNNNAGLFGSPSADFRVATSSSRDYVEHIRRQSEPKIEIEWTAPAVGTGDVSIYAAGNAVDFSSSTSGDNADSAVLTLQESGASSTKGVELTAAFEVFQTSSNTLQLAFGDRIVFPAQFSIHDLSGKVLKTGTANTANQRVSVISDAPQLVLVVVRDADGQGGVKRIMLR